MFFYKYGKSQGKDEADACGSTVSFAAAAAAGSDYSCDGTSELS